MRGIRNRGKEEEGENVDKLDCNQRYLAKGQAT